jgi:hypothetical protein
MSKGGDRLASPAVVILGLSQHMRLQRTPPAPPASPLSSPTLGRGVT